MKKIIRLLVMSILSAALVVSLFGCSSSVGTGKKAETVSTEKETKQKEESSKKANTDLTEEEISTADSKSTEVTTTAGGSVEQPETQPQTEAYSYLISVTVDGGAYGGIMAETTLGYSYQPTAMDVLFDTGVSADVSGDYVSGINGLYEFDHGPTSGWLYQVNGATPGVSAASYRLNSGDSVFWYYQAE